jgi:endonuclease/exonuclease/phosphatase family metal-dependent hydrolase
MRRIIVITSAAILLLLGALCITVIVASGPSVSSDSGIMERGLPAPFMGGTLTVMTWNIGYASGMENNKGNVLSSADITANLDRIAASIRKNNADIVALQEIDFNSRRSHGINQLRYLQEKLNFPFAAYILNWNKRYVPYPMSLDFKKHFGRMQSGQAVLSRVPITENTAEFLAKPFDKPFWYNMFYISRAVQRVKVLVAGRELDLYNVHLEAFHTDTRMYQAIQLLDLMKARGFTAGFVVGDFNSLPLDARKKLGFADEPEADFTGDNTIQVLKQKGGLAEVVPDSINRLAESPSFTYPSVSPTRRLDYIFYSPGIHHLRWSVDKGAGTGSDHLPVTAVFGID